MTKAGAHAPDLRMSATLTAALAFAGALAIAPAAWAQNATDVLEEEIIVTATKHGEALVQDVPLAMTAYGAAQLQALNFQSLQSLSYTMPNVQLEDIGTSPGIANFSIRGLGINSSIPSVDPTVGVFVDGVYYGINAGVVVDNFDLEAVEVLRGPQGTLYGRNVTGGAVLIRTTEPSDVFRFQGRAGVETGLEYTADAMVTGPLVRGVLSGKLAVYHNEDEGWFENDFDGSQFGAAETNIYRGALRWTPAPNFEAILRVEQGFSDSDGPASQNHGLFGRHTFDFSVNNRGFASGDWEQATLETNWDVDFGNGTITNIVGWRTYESATSSDIDATGTTPAPLTFVNGTQFHARAYTAQDQWSDELRYAGEFGPVDVTTGLYWFQQDLLYIEERFLFAGLLPSPPYAAALPFWITRVGGGQGEFSTFGAFVNADWHLNDEFTLNFGLRYTEEEKDARVSRVRRGLTPVPVAPFAVPPDNLDGAAVVPGEGVVGGSIDARTLNFSDSPFDLSWEDTSPRFGFQWQPSDDTNIYGFWAKGFRSGGVNFRVTTLSPVTGSGAPTAFDSEEQSSFELGWKQDLFDRRVRVNLALFHNTIDNMQRETNVPEPGSGVQQVIVNAGEAVIRGAELDARIRVTENFIITGQVGYTDGEYESVTADLNGDGIVNVADRNLEIPRLAPWTYGVNLIYDAHIFGGTLSSRIGYNHRDPSFYNDNNLGRLAEADIVDANFTYRPENGRWALSLYGENLTNDVTWGGDTILPPGPTWGNLPGGPRATFSPLNEGRVVGVELRVDLGG